MGRHSRTTTRRWAVPGRAAALTGVLGATVLGIAASPLGMAVAAEAGPTAAVSAAAADDEGPDLVEDTPCTATAAACVDLARNLAWLIDDGEVVRGPVPVTHGGPGKDTPAGTFTVQWKDQNHRSAEFDDAPMPYAVFFAPGGVAFHEGSLERLSAGCVHLSHDDAAAWYDALEVGDEVQIR